MLAARSLVDGARAKFEASARRVRKRLGTADNGVNVSLSKNARIFLVALVACGVTGLGSWGFNEALWFILAQVTIASQEVFQHATLAAAITAVLVRALSGSVPCAFMFAVCLIQFALNHQELHIGWACLLLSDVQTLRYNIMNYLALIAPLQVLGLRNPCIRGLNELVSLVEGYLELLVVEIGEEGVVNVCVGPAIMLILFAGSWINNSIVRSFGLGFLVWDALVQIVRSVRGQMSTTVKEWPSHVFRMIHLQETSRQFEDVVFQLLLTMQSERLWNCNSQVIAVLFSLTTIVCIRTRTDVLLSFVLLASSVYVAMNPQEELVLQMRLGEEMLLNHEAIRIKLALRDELRYSRRTVFVHSLASGILGLLQGLKVNLVLGAMVIAGSIFFSHNRRDRVGRRLIVKEIESRNFIDHAIKQKLAGCATSIELALNDSGVERCLSPETINVLTTALAECRLGTVLCLETTLKRQLSEGTYVSRPIKRKLGDVVNAWSRDWHDVQFKILRQKDFKLLDEMQTNTQDLPESRKVRETSVALDWSLCQNFLESLITRVRAIAKGPSMFLTIHKYKDRVEIRFRIHVTQPLSHLKSLIPLLKAVQATVRVRRHWLTLNLPTSSEEELKDFNLPERKTGGSQVPESPRLQSFQSDTSMTATDATLPPGLVFAVLDDSAIVRLNLRIISSRYWEASPRSVFTGDNEEDTRSFVQRCMELQPEICILDENLDYSNAGGRLISGSVIAQDLRTAGFDGVIVIHSANELMASDVDFRIVDGFIRKGADRAIVKNDLARLYFRRASRSLEKRRLSS